MGRMFNPGLTLLYCIFLFAAGLGVCALVTDLIESYFHDDHQTPDTLAHTFLRPAALVYAVWSFLCISARVWVPLADDDIEDLLQFVFDIVLNLWFIAFWWGVGFIGYEFAVAQSGAEGTEVGKVGMFTVIMFISVVTVITGFIQFLKRLLSPTERSSGGPLGSIKNIRDLFGD